MPYALCRHIHPNGRKCDAAALKGKPYCYYHDRLHRAYAKQQSPSDTGAVDIPDIEDGITLQIALSRILRALAANKLDPVRAGRLLYGIQIAAQSRALSNGFSPSAFSVKSVTLSDSGEELGPKIIDCDDLKDCSSCPFKDECRDFDGPVEDEEDEEEEDDDDKGNAEELTAGAEHLEPARDLLGSGHVLPIARLLTPETGNLTPPNSSLDLDPASGPTMIQES